MVLTTPSHECYGKKLPKRVDDYNRIFLQSYEKNINVLDIYGPEMMLWLSLKGQKDKDKLINKKSG